MRSSRLLRLLLFLSVCALLLMAGPGNKAAFGSEWCSGTVCEEWVARYNNPTNGSDGAAAIAADSLGNVYVAGNSQEAPGSTNDFKIVKYDGNGNQLWAASYSAPDKPYNILQAMVLDGSGNAYVTGYSMGAGGAVTGDYTTVKFSSDGNIDWAASYDGPAHGQDEADAITLDDSGNVYVTGESKGSGTNFDYATVKYDNDGRQLWCARYDGPKSGVDQATAVRVWSGGVYVTGASEGLSNYDFATIKYDGNGDQQWVSRYADPSGVFDYARALAVNDSGVYVTGYLYGSLADYVTVKYDDGGNEQWDRIYQGPGNSGGIATALAIDGSGNAYVTGYAGGGYATLTYDTSGTEMWASSYINPNSTPNDLIVDGAGYVYVTGESNYDYATVKYDANGEEVWTATYNGPSNWEDGASALTLDGSGNVYVSGYSQDSVTGSDFATIKYSQPSTPWPTFTFTPGPSPSPTATSTPVRGPGPDLIVDDMFSTQTMENYCDTPAGFGVAVKNIGTDTAGPSVTMVTGGMAGTIYIDTPAVAPGQSVYVSGNVGMGGLLTGTANWDHAVPESAYWNNSLTEEVVLITLPTCTATPTGVATATATPIVGGTPDPAGVGGIAEPPDDFTATHGGGGLPVGEIAMLAGVAVVAGSAGGWYARRRFGSQ